jgi:hypothetical protein
MKTWIWNEATKLCCKIIPRTSVEQTKDNGLSYLYLYPFKEVA